MHVSVALLTVYAVMNKGDMYGTNECNAISQLISTFPW